jgi:hypothetical protein
LALPKVPSILQTEHRDCQLLKKVAGKAFRFTSELENRPMVPTDYSNPKVARAASPCPCAPTPSMRTSAAHSSPHLHVYPATNFILPTSIDLCRASLGVDRLKQHGVPVKV